jgi:hypothetical protein
MPTPSKNESRKDFVARCIPIVINDKTAKTPIQAVAVCNSMFDTAAKKTGISMSLGGVDQEIEITLSGGILSP